jgi:hypothetical protein
MSERPCPGCGEPLGERYGPSKALCWCCWERLNPPDDDDKADEKDDHGRLAAIPDYPLTALPSDAQKLVCFGESSGLPHALVAGAAMSALAAAVGPSAHIEVQFGWSERAILWVPLIAPAGAGKSPAQALAFGPLREHDRDTETRVLLDDLTFEALARELNECGGALTLELDELSMFLRGLGEYKRSGGGDRGRLLRLWTGAPWSYSRVGGGKTSNGVRLRIDSPTVGICGGLQSHLHALLGEAEDGLRPRWLPHLAAMPDHEPREVAGDVGWDLALQPLLDKRSVPREWRFDDEAHEAFLSYQRRWKYQARNGEPAGVSAALVKADVHLARVALVLAEAELAHPGVGGHIRAGIVQRAAAIVDYTLDCWRALPESGGLALSVRDQKLDAAGEKLVAYLEAQGGEATRRQLQRNHVAGSRTAEELTALLKRYEAANPGCVLKARPQHGGHEQVVVKAPRRVPKRRLSKSMSPNGDIETDTAPNADEQRDSGDVTTGDIGGGDIGFGDIGLSLNGTPEEQARAQRLFEEYGALSAGEDDGGTWPDVAEEGCQVPTRPSGTLLENPVNTGDSGSGPNGTVGTGTLPVQRGRPVAERSGAMVWLTDRLARGPTPAGDLKADAVEAGISERTLRRAADDIGVVRTTGRGSTWALPEGER